MPPNLRRAQGERQAKAAQKGVDTSRKKAEREIAKGHPKPNEIRQMRELKKGKKVK